MCIGNVSSSVDQLHSVHCLKSLQRPSVLTLKQFLLLLRVKKLNKQQEKDVHLDFDKILHRWSEVH